MSVKGALEGMFSQLFEFLYISAASPYYFQLDRLLKSPDPIENFFLFLLCKRLSNFG